MAKEKIEELVNKLEQNLNKGFKVEWSKYDGAFGDSARIYVKDKHGDNAIDKYYNNRHNIDVDAEINEFKKSGENYAYNTYNWDKDEGFLRGRTQNDYNPFLPSLSPATSSRGIGNTFDKPS